MKVGVLCHSEERFQFFRQLLQGHSLVRIFLERGSREEQLADLDGVFVDGSLAESQEGLLATLQARGFMFGLREEDPPCMVRQDEAGHLHVQCGRQAAARLRAARGVASSRTQTLIFQEVAEDVP